MIRSTTFSALLLLISLHALSAQTQIRSGSNAATPLGTNENWQSGIGLSGANGTVRASAWHDGRLFIAGDFRSVAGVPADGLAMWDGERWHGLGEGVLGSIYALLIVDSTLYVGGDFRRIEGANEYRDIAAYDIATGRWSSLDRGIGGLPGSSVLSLAHDGERLYAGGWFIVAGSTVTVNIAAWDGVMWRRVGTGANNLVRALAFDGENLYAGGDFTLIGDVSTRSIARYSPETDRWSAIPGADLGTSSVVASFAADSTWLYVGGDFRASGSGAGAFNNIARMNRSTGEWDDMLGGVTRRRSTGIAVQAIALRGDDVFIGGRFDNLVSTPFDETEVGMARDIARWNRTSESWSLLPRTSSITGQVYPSTGLMKGHRTVGDITDFDGYHPRDDQSTTVTTMVAGAGGELFIGGAFDFAGPIYVIPLFHQIHPDPEAVFSANICRLLPGDTLFGTVGSGSLDAEVRTLYREENHIYAGGKFFRAGDEPVNYIARFNLTTRRWEEMDGGMTIRQPDSASVSSIISFQGELYVGGRFDRAGSIEAHGLAHWNRISEQWESVSGREFEEVTAMAVSGDTLAVVGRHGLSLWNGTSWSDVGRTNNAAFAVEVDGYNFYIGGQFDRVNDIMTGNLAVWNAQTGLWDDVSGGTSGRVFAIREWNGHIYVGGDFAFAGTLRADGLARWGRGSKVWEKVGTGLIPQESQYKIVHALHVGRYGLYVGGSFVGYGQGGSNNGAYGIALWDGFTWSTLGNGVLKLKDYGDVLAMTSDDERLYVGGDFHFAGSEPAGRFAEWIFPEATGNSIGSEIPNPVTHRSSERADNPDDQYWDDRFDPSKSLPGVNNEVFALLPDSDSTLYVAGGFDRVVGLPVRNIAYWNGIDWESLDNGVQDGIDGIAFALAARGDDLFVAGQFSEAGGTPANGIARWNRVTRTWSPLGSGVTSDGAGFPFISDIAFDGDDLVVAGSFSHAGGVPAENIARWDGVAWHPLDDGIDGNVSSLLVHEGTIYAGGNFGQAGGISVGNLARWSNGEWHAITPGPVGTVNDLAIYGDELLVAGEFTLDDMPTNLAIWRDDTLRAFTHQTEKIVGLRSLLVDDRESRIYTGGSFTFEPDPTVPQQMVYGGVIKNVGYQTRVDTPTVSSWLQLSGGVNGPVNALAHLGDQIAVAGYFSKAGNTEAASVALWDPKRKSWRSLTSGRLIGAISSIVMIDGRLYGAGPFEQPKDPKYGLSQNHIAWLGSSGWHRVPGLIEGTAVDVDTVGSQMIVGGQFISGGEKIAVNVLAWNRQDESWNAVTPGSGVADWGDNSHVAAVVTDPEYIYVGGLFSVVDTFETPNVARYSRSRNVWEPLGEGLDGRVTALAVGNDGTLYAGGHFARSGSRPISGIGSFKNGEWRGLGDGVDGEITSLAVDDRYLYVGGTFTKAGEQDVANIAVWNLAEQQWEALGEGLDSDLLPGVDALTMIDGTLFAAGFFNHSGSDSIRNIARWTGSVWEPLGSGVDFAVFAMAPDRHDLYVVGSFKQAGAKPSPYIALWHDPTLSVEYVETPVAGSLTSGPNPVLTETLIRYAIPQRDEVHLSILDLSGREIIRLHDGPLSPGEHQVRWVPENNLPAGLYIVRMATSLGVVSQKVVVY